MQTTRWEILQILKERSEATVDELAEALGLAPITVRHHLSILEKDRLIASHCERGAVGRPHYVYSLTDQAQELFPKKYHLLADRLLTELKSIADDQQLSILFDRIAQGITAEYAAKVEGKNTEEKLSLLVDLLGQEGFLAQWDQIDGRYVLKEYSCPYYYVGQRHPEVCRLDLQMIANVLEAQVERKTCMIDGDEFCTYRITPFVPMTQIGLARLKHRSAWQD